MTVTPVENHKKIDSDLLGKIELGTSHVQSRNAKHCTTLFGIHVMH